MALLCSIEQGLVIARGNGLLTEKDFLDALNDIIPRTDGAALMMNVLVTFDERSAFGDIQFEVLEHIKDCIERWLKVYPGRNVRTALMGDFVATSALFTLWQALADAYELGTEVRLFEREEHALTWLKEA